MFFYIQLNATKDDDKIYTEIVKQFCVISNRFVVDSIIRLPLESYFDIIIICHNNKNNNKE